MVRKLIVGLGNPGDSYENNRHNLGFKLVDYIFQRHQILTEFDRRKSVYGKFSLSEQKEVVVFKPQTFSNLSGEAVLYIASFLKIFTKDILVILEDPLIEFGVAKINLQKDSIKHQGIISLSEQLNTQDYATLSVGVGPMTKGISEEDFCMQDFSKKELERLPDLLEEIYKICWQFVTD